MSENETPQSDDAGAEDGDPRIITVEQHLAPELPASLSPDQRHYAAAVAVAVLDGDR
ncbi:hypothetical protein HCN52_12360, partial [Streptomyces bohaiensis]|nr:hypothetical protein [Streptomyces bohaiensis]